MKAALQLFARKGFEDASVDDICLAAGCSKGGFYFHFPSKETLLVQLVGETTNTLSGGRSSSPEGWPYALLSELWSQASRKQGIRECLVQYYNSRLESLRETKISMPNSGTADPNTMASLLLALETGLQIQSQVMPSSGYVCQAQEVLGASLMSGDGTTSVSLRLPRNEKLQAG